MGTEPHFYTDTELGKGLKDLFVELQQRLELNGEPIKAYIAGGIAVHLYTAYRVSMDVDAEFGKRLHLPTDLGIEVMRPNGRPIWLHFDTQYNTTFALMHEDYMDDAKRVPLEVEYFDIHALSPVDLAVSKISRFSRSDQNDIAALVKHGLTTADAIESRARDALPGYVGSVRPLEMNIEDAVKIARNAETLRLDGYQPEPGSELARALARPPARTSAEPSGTEQSLREKLRGPKR